MNTLTVKELIADLQQYDQDLPVVSCSNYGDPIPATEVNEAYLSTTNYSDSGYKVVEDGDQRDEDQLVVVLNYDYL